MKFTSRRLESSRSPKIPDDGTTSVGNASYVLGALALVSVINYLDRTVWSVLAIAVKAELGLSDTQIGVLGGFAFAVCYATMGLPLARLADRRNRVAILSACVMVWSVATAACGFSQSFLALFLSRIVVGLGEAGGLPASHSIVADYFPPRRRAFALGIIEAGGSLGVMIGIMLAGVLSDAFGWRVTFIILGMPGVLVALLVYLTVREPARGRLDPPTYRPLYGQSAVAALLSRRTYRRIVITISLCVMAYYGTAQWLPSFLFRSHGMSASEIGVRLGFAFGIGSILGATGGALLSPIMIKRDRRWEMRLPALAFTLCAPIFLVALQVSSSWAAMAAIFFASATMGVGFAPALAAIQSVAEPTVRATAVAIVMFVSALAGQGAGPVVVGLLSDMLATSLGADSLRQALSIYTVLFVASGVYAWVTSRTMVKDVVN